MVNIESRASLHVQIIKPPKQSTNKVERQFVFFPMSLNYVYWTWGNHLYIGLKTTIWWGIPVRWSFCTATEVSFREEPVIWLTVVKSVIECVAAKAWSEIRTWVLIFLKSQRPQVPRKIDNRQPFKEEEIERTVLNWYQTVLARMRTQERQFKNLFSGECRRCFMSSVSSCCLDEPKHRLDAESVLISNIDFGRTHGTVIMTHDRYLDKSRLDFELDRGRYLERKHLLG
jgi:hypothetical protein